MWFQGGSENGVKKKLLVVVFGGLGCTHFSDKANDGGVLSYGLTIGFLVDI